METDQITWYVKSDKGAILCVKIQEIWNYFSKTWTGDGSTADQIWEFQRNLAAIVMMIMGSDDEHNPVYLVQFNENGAR